MMQKHVTRLAALLITLAGVTNPTIAEQSQTTETCTVFSITDGDTLKALCSGVETKIRFADIDTPEIHGAQCGAELMLARLATNELSKLTLHKDIQVRWRGSSRDRRVAFVSIDGEDVGQTLIKNGFACSWKHDNRNRELEPRPNWCALSSADVYRRSDCFLKQ